MIIQNSFNIYILKLMPINIEDVDYFQLDLTNKLQTIITSLCYCNLFEVNDKKNKNKDIVKIFLSYSLMDIQDTIQAIINKYMDKIDITYKFNNEYQIINDIITIIENKKDSLNEYEVINENIEPIQNNKFISLIINYNNENKSILNIKEYNQILDRVLNKFDSANIKNVFHRNNNQKELKWGYK